MTARPMLARLAVAAASLASWALHAAPAGLLYDPEPPPNSAYVRVINATPRAMSEISVDGRARIRALAANDASEYLVLAAGKRTLSIASAGSPATRLAVEVVAGRAVSIAFGSAAQPWIFEDKANTNLAKAVLGVYHLDASAGPVDVVAANGATKVVAGLAPGTSKGLTVNPIKVDLSVVAAGSTSPSASASVAMQPGGTYSLLLFPGARGEFVAKAIQNKVERYEGK